MLFDTLLSLNREVGSTCLPYSEGEPSWLGTQAHSLTMTWLCLLPNSVRLLWAWAAM